MQRRQNLLVHTPTQKPASTAAYAAATTGIHRETFPPAREANTRPMDQQQDTVTKDGSSPAVIGPATQGIGKRTTSLIQDGPAISA